jgi:hypothetical protein
MTMCNVEILGELPANVLAAIAGVTGSNPANTCVTSMHH